MICYWAMCFYMIMFLKVMAIENICHCKNQSRCDTFTQTGCHSDCEETWYGQYCQKHNIAQGKPASQSSELSGYGCPCAATRALDGDTNMNFTHGSCTHTDDTDTKGAHWTVFLISATPLNISYVQLYLRQDHEERNQGLQILVDDKPCFNSKTALTGMQRTNCSSTLSGNNVTVRIPGNQLTLCEVRIFVCSDGWFGEDCDKQCQCLDTSEVCDKKTGYCRSGCQQGTSGCLCADKRQCINFPTSRCTSCKADWFGSYCQKQNIARGMYTNQSSTYGTSTSNLAVDGNTASNFVQGTCTHTENFNASWNVYFNYFSAFNISQMRIYLRSNIKHRNENLTLYVNGQQCYKLDKDIHFSKSVTEKEAELNIKCTKPLKGQSLSVQIPGKFLTLCEVQVFVCSDGWFSEDCDKQCLCFNTSEVCDKDTGYCRSGCIAGKFGQGCQQACKNGTFGPGCIKQCLCNNTQEACDKKTGHCESGCIAGKQGTDCQTDCKNGSFGFNCTNTCQCANINEACNKTTGHCESGCTPGKQGDDCQTECNNGTFGYGCIKHCLCYNTQEACDKKTGHCESGCIAGELGDDCQTDCKNGSFGLNCTTTCLCATADEACNKTTGHCGSGCTPGKQGEDCQTDCNNGTFGSGCIKSCQCNDTEETCNKKTGHCVSGCIAGKQEIDCQTDCKNGSFGFNCTKTCYCDVVDEACNKTTGHCESGCTPGKQGDDCQTARKEKMDQPSSSNAGMIAGIVVTVLVLLLIAVAGFFIWRKRVRRSPATGHTGKTESTFNNISETDYSGQNKRKCTGSTDKSISSSQKSSTLYQNKTPEAKDKHTATEDNVYENTDTYYNILPSSIPLATLRQYIEDRLSGVGFENEYKLLRRGLTADHDEGKKPENKKRNRFLELYPYDHSRLVLSPDGNAKSDYINASYVKGFRESSIFIAAQGPNPVTIADFWRMIWQENTSLVVMLTRLMEMTRKKCEQYWPNENETKTCGNIIISSNLSTVRADFTIRTFTVHHVKEASAKRVVTQLHFTSWPDHDVPSASALVGFWKIYRHLQQDKQSNTGPVVVHCSAGVGRTGTFIGLDSLFDEAESENKVNVFTCVSKMREARMNMVQTASQYGFLHESLLESIESKDTFYTSSDFVEKFGTDAAFTRFQESDISKEFQSLDSMRNELKEEIISDARLPENVNKNKTEDIVPANKTRPFLSTSATGRNDYINAVVLQTITQSLGVIATQTPLKDTVVDFWRLVYDHDCFTIVCLDDTKYVYPKRDTPLDFTPFCITLSQEDTACDSFNKMQITLSIPGKNDSTRQITMYKLKVGLTDNIAALFEFVNEVDRKANTGEHKLLVHCLDGSRLCGLFCSILNIISRLKLDKVVDVYLTVRELQRIRPQFIDTYEQYKFCYDMVKEHHRSSTVYANM